MTSNDVNLHSEHVLRDGRLEPNDMHTLPNE
jgi:hypothetical protein